jgi:hypothetical protein
LNAANDETDKRQKLNRISPFSQTAFCLSGIFVMLCFFGVPPRLHADGGLYLFPKGAKAEGLGRNGLLNVDVWAVYNNQAALAAIDEMTVGVNYENRFQINQIGVSSGAFAAPALTGTVGVDIAHTGIESYGETRIGAGYGKQLAKKLSLGVHFNYHLLSFGSGYPDLYAFTGEIGLIAEPLTNIFIGAHIFNPTLSKLNSRNEISVPLIFTIGAGYKTERLFLVSEFEKEQTGEFIPRIGGEYTMFKNMCLRTGVSFNPVEMCFGVGWTIGNLQLDVAFSWHEALGYSPQAALSYKFAKLLNKNKK